MSLGSDLGTDKEGSDRRNTSGGVRRSAGSFHVEALQIFLEGSAKKLITLATAFKPHIYIRKYWLTGCANNAQDLIPGAAERAAASGDLHWGQARAPSITVKLKKGIFNSWRQEPYKVTGTPEIDPKTQKMGLGEIA